MVKFDSDKEQITDLDSKVYRLKSGKHFSVDITEFNICPENADPEDDDTLCAEIKELQLHAFGPDTDVAIKELKQDVVDLFIYYNSLPDAALAKYPLVWKRILNDKVEKI